MAYTHLEVTAASRPKQPGAPCGDLYAFERTAFDTTLVLADGIGSGPRARIAATLCAARLLELLRCGFSLREAFARLVRTMSRWRDPSLPYAAFTLARVLNDGGATILCYEMPPPLLVSAQGVSRLPGRPLAVETELAEESRCALQPGQGLLLLSDGVTQAGLGPGAAQRLAAGWTAEGVASFASALVFAGQTGESLPGRVLERARELDGGRNHDDCTALLAGCRPGRVLTIFTGPPSTRGRDAEAVRRFLEAEGRRVVLGGTTARLVAAGMGTELEVEQGSSWSLSPPRYYLPEIDLVAEGVVTLNQLYNILDDPPGPRDPRNPVGELHRMVHEADRVNLIVGVAANPANEDPAFRQQGIVGRMKIVPLIEKKLKSQDKLVVVDYL